MRTVTHSGRIPAECDTSGEAVMGQGNTGRAHSHVRVTTTSFVVFIAAAASIPGGKLRESSRHDIRENGRGPKRYTVKVWAPGLKQLRDRDNIMLQNILDLTD